MGEEYFLHPPRWMHSQFAPTEKLETNSRRHRSRGEEHPADHAEQCEPEIQMIYSVHVCVKSYKPNEAAELQSARCSNKGRAFISPQACKGCRQ